MIPRFHRAVSLTPSGTGNTPANRWRGALIFSKPGHPPGGRRADFNRGEPQVVVGWVSVAPDLLLCGNTPVASVLAEGTDPRARNCPVVEDPIPLLPQRPVHLAPLRRGFPLCPNIGNHLPRSRICFGAEERNSPRVIIGKASSPALRPGGRGFLDPNRGGTTSKGEPLVAAGVRPVRAIEPPAPAAITRLQVLLAWDDRIANGQIAPAVAVAQQA